MQQHARSVALALSIPFASASADVLTVDDDGPADFATVSAAVAAAMDGDVVLIRAGSYAEPSAIQLGDKSLTLVGDSGPAVTIDAAIEVVGLAADGRVLLHNLNLWAGSASNGLDVIDCAGQVTLDQCHVLGASGAGDVDDGWAGLRVEGSAAVLVSNSQLSGGSGIDSPQFPAPVGRGGAALVMTGDSLVALQGSYVNGGYGGYAWPGDPYSWGGGGDGGNGASIDSGVLALSSSSIEGGWGGDGGSGGNGGDGLLLDGGQVTLMGFSYVSAGPGGFGFDAQFGGDGTSGATSVNNGGSLTDLGGVYHWFSLPPVVREGQVEDLYLGGPADELPVLLFGVERGFDVLPLFDGVLGLAPAPIVVLPVSGLGGGSVDFTAPVLPPGVDSRQYHLQPAFIGAGTVGLGASATLLVLDDAL